MIAAAAGHLTSLFGSIQLDSFSEKEKEKNVFDRFVPPMSHPPERPLRFPGLRATDFKEIPPEIRTTDLYIRRERHQL